MLDLTAIQEELQDLNALIARHERTLATHTEAKSLRANIQTLKRRRQALEEDLDTDQQTTPPGTQRLLPEVGANT